MMNKDKEQKEEKTSEEVQPVLEEGHEQESLDGNQVNDEKSEISQEELKELREKAEELKTVKESCLRTMADFENAKKRLAREKEDFAKFANETIISQFLPVLDNFDRALAHASENDASESFISGITLIRKQIFDILKNSGLEPIEALGKEFDPHVHEAVGVIETDEHPADTVVEEVQSGFMLKDKLLRPSWVRVASSKNEDVDVQGQSNAQAEHNNETN